MSGHMLNCLILLKKVVFFCCWRHWERSARCPWCLFSAADIPPIEWDFHVCIHCSFASHAALHLHTLEQQAGGLMLGAEADAEGLMQWAEADVSPQMTIFKHARYGQNQHWNWFECIKPSRGTGDPMMVPYRRESKPLVAPQVQTPGDKILDQILSVWVVSRLLRPKWAIPHTIISQNKRFYERFFLWTIPLNVAMGRFECVENTKKILISIFQWSRSQFRVVNVYKRVPVKYRNDAPLTWSDIGQNTHINKIIQLEIYIGTICTPGKKQ